MGRTRSSSKTNAESGQSIKKGVTKKVAKVNKQVKETQPSSSKSLNLRSAATRPIKRKYNPNDCQGDSDPEIIFRQPEQEITHSHEGDISPGTSSCSANAMAPLQTRSKRSRIGQAVSQVRATFDEGNQTFDMTIDADPDDSLCYSEDECDPGDDQLQAGSSAERQLTDNDGSTDEDVEAEDSDDEYPIVGSFGSPKVAIKPLTHQQKMHALDLEMRDKMKDLHRLLKDGGMTGTVDFMNQHFCMEESSRATRVLEPTESNYFRDYCQSKRAKRIRFENVNQNSNVTESQPNDKLSICTQSEETIYHNAIEKRTSSSSDDCIDISDEYSPAEDSFIYLSETEREKSKLPHPWRSSVGPGLEPRQNLPPPPPQPRMEVPPTPEENADEMIRNAKRAKAKILPPKGKDDRENFMFIAQVDQDYVMVGTHLDETTKEKIVKGEYVDFSKLLPKDKVMLEEDGRMELAIKNGRAYWMPASAAESVQISNFVKWEQAFRLFSNVYTNTHLHKSGELIQYNYTIHSIAQTYIWENVYAYDKEFRIHISRHQEQSWSVILQQAWSMKQRDRIFKSDYHSPSTPHTTSSHNMGGKQNK